MFRASISTLRLVSLNALRFLFVCAGAWLAAVGPVEFRADARRAANAAAGHVPNMDPGVMAVMALVLTVLILVAVFFVEITRCAIGGKPLAMPSCLALGAVTACPVGYSIGFDAPTSNTILFLASAFGLVAFYAVRRAWLKQINRYK